jgi:hypothetical protein
MWDEKEIEKLIFLHKNGKTFKEISVLLNRTVRGVEIKLRRLGYKSNKSHKKNKYSDYNWEVIQNNYNNGLSYRDIVNKFQLTPQSIKWAQQKKLLKLRSNSEGLKLAWKNGKFKIKNTGITRYRQLCEFKFNLSDFPTEYDFSLIKKYGWYSPVNKKNNLNGISRDHIIPVNYGFKNKIDPYVISHPANCQLLKHSDNSSKRDKLIMTLDELLEKIKIWEKKYGKYENKVLILDFNNERTKKQIFKKEINKDITKRERKIFYCSECGKKISYGSKFCLKCSRKHNRICNRPNKKELLEQIKELGYRGTGRKYGVSDNAIRKWLKNY